LAINKYQIMIRPSICRPASISILLVLASVLLLACCPALVSSEDVTFNSSAADQDGGGGQEEEQCQREVCGFNTEYTGYCIQRPVSEGGQGSEVQAAMREVYALVQEGGVAVGGGGGTGTANANSTAPEEAILPGLHAVRAGSSVPNSEGLYYCLRDAATGADAFYWVLNCEVLREDRGASGDYVLCADLTPAEEAAVGGGGAVGYVVDATLFGDDVWRRFVFDDAAAVLTSVQPIAGGGFVCSERPWFATNYCVDPLATTCPTGFEGSTGRGAFQTYGGIDVAVVAQDVREYHIAPCLEESTSSSASSSSVFNAAVKGTVAVVMMIMIAASSPF